MKKSIKTYRSINVDYYTDKYDNKIKDLFNVHSDNDRINETNYQYDLLNAYQDGFKRGFKVALKVRYE